jgi:lysophospholipase L1-like esterase
VKTPPKPPGKPPPSSRAGIGQSTRRFVALGDSFTEGVGDPEPRLPNGVRGWADRVAERLAKAEPGWEYANLAVRSKRLDHIVSDQLCVALALRPTLVSLYAGGNDLMDASTDMADLMRRYERLVASLTESGAAVILFTGYDIPLAPAVWLFRRRNRFYNDAVRRIALRYDAILIDYWAFDGFGDRRMWSADRLHLSKRGHKLMASKVLDALGVEHSIALKERAASARWTAREWGRARSRWIREWILPLIRRKIRGVTLGDELSPRWPTPVTVPPHGGLRKLSARE